MEFNHVGEILAIFIIIMAIINLGVGLYCFINAAIFSSYLKKNNYNRWKELTTFLGIGPGAMNAFRTIPYFYNDKDTEDSKILCYKDRLKIGINLFISIMVFIIILTIIMFISFKYL